jgi:CheY-like chemotaxis protein
MPQLATFPPLRVLIVDDLPDLIQSLATLLRLWGHDARGAHDGPEALHVAADYHPDVVLLDVSLPGMDGYQVARRLRSNPDFHRTFLVSVTGHGGDADIQRSREAGCDCHLLKPVNPTDLERLLASRKEARGAAPSEDAPDVRVAVSPDVGETAGERLRHHRYLPLRRITCEYRDGVLTLWGHLPTYYLKQIAQTAVGGIAGVERIKNEIKVDGSIPAHPR